MTHAADDDQPADSTAGATPSSPDAIRADIEQTRAELAETVDALGDKLNVKAQAADKADAAKQKVAATAAQARAAAPEPVQHALDSVGAKAGPAAHQLAVTTEPHRGKILAGTGAALLLLLVVRRRRKNRATA